MVGSLGLVRRILQQLDLHVYHESSVWYRWWPDDSEYRGLVGHHLPARKKTEPWVRSFWSNGTCGCSWRFSCLRNYRPAVGVEMVVLHAVRSKTFWMRISLADVFSSRGLLGFVVYGTAIVTVPVDEPLDPNGEVDWVGAYLGVGALILFNFVWK